MGKKLKENTKDIDLNKEYTLSEAVELIKKADIAKFDSTIEIHMKLGIDLKKPEQNIRSTVVLPNGTGKTKKILVFTEAEGEKEASGAGADYVGLEDMIEKINKGWLDFDVVIASPDVMPKIAKVAKTLGSRGLMPNPKAGTVTNDIAKTVEEFKKGKIEFRTDPLGGIHAGIAKKSFDNEKIVENFKTFYNKILSAKPSTVKGAYIKSVSISSTMGPGLKIDTTKLK